MKHLDKQQIKLLKKIKKVKIFNCTNLSKDELAKVRFLRSNGLLDAETQTMVAPTRGGEVTFFEGNLLSVQISEEGKACLSETKSNKMRWWIPTIISLFAAIGAYRSELSALLQVIARLLR